MTELLPSERETVLVFLLAAVFLLMVFRSWRHRRQLAELKKQLGKLQGELRAIEPLRLMVKLEIMSELFEETRPRRGEKAALREAIRVGFDNTSEERLRLLGELVECVDYGEVTADQLREIMAEEYGKLLGSEEEREKLRETTERIARKIDWGKRLPGHSIEISPVS
jgi:hypothetical protein